MSKRTAIITDSTCDIPSEWLAQYDIVKVPLTIIWNEQTYLDGVEMIAESFYERLETDPHHPTTSQPAPQQFVEVYQEAQAKGYEQILVITISAEMSGTFRSAKQATESSPIPVHVIDSKSNSMGLGWQVISAARTRDSGQDLQAMIAAADRVRKNLAYFISLDTIDYLVKGGRIGGAVKFLNSLLKIKPLIYVNHESGTVGASVPARSRQAAIDGLYKQFFKHGDASKKLHITVLHNAAIEEAEQLAEKIRQEYHPEELFITIVSPILGVHTGPRAIAICGYFEED